jgi:hypothetical protein
MKAISLKTIALILLTLSSFPVYSQCTGWAEGGTNSNAWNVTCKHPQKQDRLKLDYMH